MGLDSIRDKDLHLPEELWQTLDWISQYYITPLGQVLKAAVPNTFLDTYKPHHVQFVKITEDGIHHLEHGKSQETPIAIIQNATMKSQNIITSTLGSIIHEIKHKKTLTPAIIIIGNVVNIYSKIKKCLKTYPSDQTVQKEDIGFDIWKNPAIVA